MYNTNNISVIANCNKCNNENKHPVKYFEFDYVADICNHVMELLKYFRSPGGSIQVCYCNFCHDETLHKIIAVDHTGEKILIDNKSRT
jgi:ribosomal protein L44E